MPGSLVRRVNAVKADILSTKLSVAREESSIAPDHVVSNIDTDPARPEQRIWGYTIWTLYWASDILVISGWQKVSSAVTLGLDWKNALGTVVLGATILGFPLCLNGKMGAQHRIPFPICIRASHGYHLARFPVVSRAITASFWFAIQGWNGGTCVRLMLGAIWPSFLHLEKTESYVCLIGGDDADHDIVSCVLAHPISTVIYTPIPAAFVVVPACMFAILGWSVHQARNVSGGLGTVLNEPPSATGEAFAYAWLKSLNVLISGFATLALNIPDFSRYSKGTNTPLIQAPLLPAIYTLLGVTAAISGSCTQAIYGKALWSPVDIIAKWDNRAAVFFGAAAWMIAQMAQNLSANSISAANDLATLFPRYLNIRRAQILIAFVAGWALVPWKIVASATAFLSFISGYGLVLGPFCGIMLSDYWIIKKQKFDVPALYDPNGRYRFNRFGCNWRAGVALVVSISPCIPGLVNAVNPNIQIGRARWIFAISWPFGFFTAAFVYLALSIIAPDHTGSLIDQSVHPDDFIKARHASREVETSAIYLTEDLDVEKK